MIYELRSYDIVTDRLQEYLAWISRHGLPVMRRFGFRIVGFWWVARDGNDAKPRTNIRWMVAWESEEEMTRQWDAMKDSEDWKAAWALVLGDDGRSRFHRRTRRAILHALVDPILAAKEYDG